MQKKIKVPMQRTMKLEIWNKCSGGGADITENIVYTGGSEKEILSLIDHDQEEILYYMRTGDMKKERCFCFQGLMIKKAGITAIRLSEADY